MSKLYRYFSFVFVLLNFYSNIAYCAATTDGSVGAVQNLSGHMTIPETLGKVSGNNLFHSFRDFNIDLGESATFTTSTATLANVISRVTGGELSTIQGQLSLQAIAGTPAFYFINPAGVTFGEGASIDMPGAFYVSTADRLKFSDGSNFNASLSESSTFTTAAPDAFGFSGRQNNSIKILTGGTLEAIDQPINIMAGDIEVNGILRNKSGGINLFANGQQTEEVPIHSELPKGGGSFSMNDGWIYTSSVNELAAGDMTISASEILLENRTWISSDTETNGPAGNINIIAGKDLEIKNGSMIASSSLAEGKAGNISIDVGNVLIDGQNSDYYTGIFNTVQQDSSGDGGNINVVSHNLLQVLNGGEITSATFSKGNAGSINIDTANMIVDGRGSEFFTGIRNTTYSNSHGNAGNVNINNSEEMQILNGSAILSSTYANGNAGEIIINSDNMVLDNAQNSSLFTGIASSAEFGSLGNSGNVYISILDSIYIHGGQVSSSTFAKGNAGSVSLVAKNLVLDGQLSDFITGITSTAEEGSQGNAGNINLSIQDLLQLSNGSEISSATYGEGKAGSVAIDAGNITLDGQNGQDGYTLISSISYANSFGNAGDAGNVTITVSDLIKVLNSSAISSSTHSEGNAGIVTINAGNALIDGRDSPVVTTITSSAEEGSLGDAGNVNLNIRDLLQVFNGGQISSSTFSSAKGNSGNVNIAAKNIVLDGQGAEFVTGIFSSASPGSFGNSGNINLNIQDLLQVLNGGQISSSTYSIGNAGSVSIEAKDLTLNGQEGYSIISSNAYVDSQGHAGNVTITVQDLLQVLNGSAITSSTFSQGNAGTVIIDAGNALIDGRGSSNFTVITSSAEDGSLGDAGNVKIDIRDLLQVINGGQILSSTFSKGNAGTVSIHADKAVLDGQNYEGIYLTGITSSAEAGSQGDAGNVNIDIRDLLQIFNGGQILSATFSKGDAGTVNINAGNAFIDGQNNKSISYTGIASSAEPGSLGNSGNVNLNIQGLLQVLNAGNISSSTYAVGNAGTVTINAKNALFDGQGVFIDSTAEPASLGDAGNVNIMISELLQVKNGTDISSSTYSVGNAGSVIIEAGDLTLNGQEEYTTISSIAYDGSQGHAGNVTITVKDLLQVLNGSAITSSTFSQGNAGTVNINADSALIDSQGSLSATAITSSAEADSQGEAGNVILNIRDLLQVFNGGQILSSTFSKGNAGTVNINAGNAVIDGQNNEGIFLTGITSAAQPGSIGDAGNVNVTIDNLLQVINGSEISSSAFAKGNAGRINIDADNLIINGGGEESAITSSAQRGSLGNAGNVNITIHDLLQILNGGRIASATLAEGDAGIVTIAVKNALLDGQESEFFTGIASSAQADSSGQTGSVDVIAHNDLTMRNYSSISLRNLALAENASILTPTVLKVSARKLSMTNSTITAASTANVAASNIEINFTDLIDLNSSAISTSAQDGNGGSIAIDGSGLLVVKNSQTTTSVLGTEGNGGNISIKTNALALKTGFIQANTAAADALGGNIIIDTPVLASTGNSLYSGGNEQLEFKPDNQFGYNVIQAAAPDGVSGDIDITAPEIDLTATLGTLTTPSFEVGNFGRSPCNVTDGSSFVVTGKAYLSTSRRDPVNLDGKPVSSDDRGGCQP
ncbi:MAG: filamentous hemagglutinin N-terminal domain-containing protein [Gammaproteobacteria bacterium]|nr:filamentous hemagglutinin N-terminal domain-containing protein [Gammaproteobacteria bacterium]